MPVPPRRLFLLPLFCLGLALAVSTFLPARTWTDREGRTLEAELLKFDAGTVTLRRRDGCVFDLARSLLSADDLAYLSALPAAGTSPKNQTAARLSPASLSFEDLNALLGLDLLTDDQLWDDEPSAVATRLRLPVEGKTAFFESYRAYPARPVTVLGASAYTLALQATDGRPTAFSVMFANRGDYPPFTNRDPRSIIDKADLRAFEQTLKASFDVLSAALTHRLGEPTRELAVGGLDAGRTSLRWTWGSLAVLVSHDPGQLVLLKIVPLDRAATTRLSDDQVRRLFKSRITRRPNGDVILEQVPMVSQGPKGYCVPATFERYLRYAGIPADMYELALNGGTDFGGGTQFAEMAAGIDRYVRRQGRRLENASIKLNTPQLARYLDEGRPLIWGLYTTAEFNALSNAHTLAREKNTDWTGWKQTVAAASKAFSGGRSNAHACLIIGYNRATNELAFTDSWGPDYAERWVPVDVARKVSQDDFWVLSW